MYRIAMVGALLLAGCQTDKGTAAGDGGNGGGPAQAERPVAQRNAPPQSNRYACAGFVVYEQDGRLWVFRTSGDALAGFLADGEPAKRVTLVGAGPDGRTLMGAEREALDAYREAVLAGPQPSRDYGRPGFTVFEEAGRLWVFRSDSDELGGFLRDGEPPKRVTLVGAGPDRRTVLGAERDTLDAYLRAVATGPRPSPEYRRSGFAVYEQDGRLWVFREGSEELEGFLRDGEPTKRVTLIGAGPDRRTLLGADRDTLEAYRVVVISSGPRRSEIYTRAGFAVYEQDGRLWVFREGSEDLAGFLEDGEPAKRVTLVGAGPDRRTLLGGDRETLDAYRAAYDASTR